MAQLAKESVDSLRAQFTLVREATLELFSPLKIEDAVIQSDSFGSPPNWHIAHVTWFFQKILEKNGELFENQNSDKVSLDYLNSYYQKYGNILPKPDRGKFPRPTVEETLGYRNYIDGKVLAFLDKLENLTGSPEALNYDLMLANQHEMQHQELMVYDFQNYFQRFPDPSDNYKPTKTASSVRQVEDFEKPSGMTSISGGIYQLGYHAMHEGSFCYDNELPEHKVYLNPFKIDIAPVTNGEYQHFIDAGGYHDFKYWLADGWDLIQTQHLIAPLYWESRGDKWMKKDFSGFHELEPDEPVVNISYYEADAYSRWAGKRLPTEAEWEKAASWNEGQREKTAYPWGNEPPTQSRANLLESYLWSPAKIGSYPLGTSHCGCHQMLGDVWEWTSSEYVLYPGFKSRFAEYTDKWAINQKVLRGGSFATPSLQIRNSYRNYFKPHERIPFAGFRCAQDS